MTQESYILSLVKEINASTKAFETSSIDGNNDARTQALEAARKLTTALEPPTETILHHSYEIPPLNMCVRVAVAMSLFHIIANHQDSKGITAEELAKSSKGERRLIVRIMRILTAAGYVAEADIERYVPTPITVAVTTPPIEASIKHRYDFGLPTLTNAPSYYQSVNFHCPTDYKDTPFQRAFNTDLGFYEYLSQQPDASRNFQTYMSALKERSPAWVDWFPVQERLIDEFDSSPPDHSDVLLVDIGGGEGHYVKLFREKFPQALGRLVLQDQHRPDEYEKLQRESIEFMKHSFFDEQPIKGARTYYLHFVLTDWSTPLALSILRRIAAAMTPDYSHLIINDAIIPDTGCQWQHAALDIIMMSSFSGWQRSEGELRELCGEAGLEVVEVSMGKGGGDGVVEAVRRV